jgi:hypothetical protein
MKRLIPPLIVVAAALSLCSSSALAFKACKNEGNRHCYAITSWHMTNGETVLGSSIKIDTVSGSVPEKGSGEEAEFFTNEVWNGFDGGKHWIESGQILAYGEAFHYFWDVYNHQGFSEIFTYCCATTNAWNTYKMTYDSGRENIHAWDVYINGTYEGYGEGLELESKELEAGLESTNANNKDSGETSYAENLGTQGDWWGSWEASGSGNYAKPEAQNYAGESWSGGCARNIFSEGNKGDIEFFDQACGSDGGLAISDASQGAAPVARPAESGSLESMNQIAELAKRQSGALGESDPTDMTVVAAQSGQALSVALPGAHAAPTTEVATDVVEMHGHFTDEHPPLGREAPSGSVMTVVIDAHTGEILGQHIGNESVAMTAIGTPAAL